MQTFVRHREQIHSNLIGLHVDSARTSTADRLAAYRNAVGAHTSDLATATAQATNLLASAVAKQASVLAYIDGFLAAAVGALICLSCVMTSRHQRAPCGLPPRTRSAGDLKEARQKRD